MAVVKNNPNKNKGKQNKETKYMQLLRASFFIFFGLFIVHLYYLSTKDQLLPQILKISTALFTFIQTIPTSILMIIGYTILIFYVGYKVGKRTKT